MITITIDEAGNIQKSRSFVNVNTAKAHLDELLVERQDAERGLSADAPEMTVGDSCSVCGRSGGFWHCQMCCIDNLLRNKKCWNCDCPRPFDPTKPK